MIRTSGSKMLSATYCAEMLLAQGKSEAFRRDEVEAMARWVRAFAADSLG